MNEPSVEVKIRLPAVVAAWYETQAGYVMKKRSRFIRDTLVTLWRSRAH